MVVNTNAIRSAIVVVSVFIIPLLFLYTSKVDMRHSVFHPESSEITISLKSGREGVMNQ